MATPRTSERKPSTKKAAPAADPNEALASETLTILLHRALVRLGEPARIGDIVREVGDDTVTPALARRQMETQPRRFVAVDRRWDITSRYLDKTKPLERTLEEVISVYGAPIPADDVAGELSQIMGRVKDAYVDVAARLLRGAPFFPIAGGLAYGLRSWLLDLISEREDDILFYNYLSADKLAPFQTAAKGLDWDGNPTGAAHTLVSIGKGQPVDNRVLQYFAWKALGEEFDGAALYDSIATDRETFLALPDHRWLLRESLSPLQALWQVQAEAAALMAPEETAVEAIVVAEAPAKPLEVTEEDAEELTSYFDGREEIARVGDLLTQIFEIRPGSSTFDADVDTLTAYLISKPDEFQWVGSDRFRAPGTLPPYIGQLPESLTFPALPRFETADGEILDQMLADAGLDEGLQDEILDPVAQDVNDQEPADQTLWPEGATAEASRLRLVLKSHHKEIGTFPLAQVPAGFFPAEPHIVELTLRDASGSGYPIYIDYDVQLVYGLFDVYSEIAAESGAVIYLEKTDKPDEYKFIDENETDANVFVSPARMEELLDFRSEVEGGTPISTYDIAHRILNHYGKGCSFLTLLTEVNLVRRTPRRLLASVLSGYSAFHRGANKWKFDAKKEQEGFNASKTEYIIQ
ncbi:MAG: hypothetical protein ACRYFS_19615 [Janthinobacterium lividum]